MKQTFGKFVRVVVATAGVMFAALSLAGVPEAEAWPLDEWEASCFWGCCGSCGPGGLCCSFPLPIRIE